MAGFFWRQIISAILILLSFHRWCGAKSIGWQWRSFSRSRCSDFFCEPSMRSRRTYIDRELAAAFKILFAELREEFSLTSDDLPHPPRERMASDAPKSLRPFGRPLRRVAAISVDSLMCGSMNLVQSRHRLHARSRDEMERYVTECEKLTAHDFYAVPRNGGAATEIGNGEMLTWPSPIITKFPANNIARADFFRCTRDWSAPTVLMLHALMSATHIGYRRWAVHFNGLGWNASLRQRPAPASACEH